ncbi:hypothetical protein OPQ81_006483 [Rhizoctonia solani]|nr:hypothetical protein OPQ81_006483 [Rhizoctonia solani]
MMAGRSVDGSLPNQLRNLTDMTIQLFSGFVAIILVSSTFSLAGALLIILGTWLVQVYISAQLPVKRHMSNARSPMFSYFHAALAGITTIRAYGAQEMVRKELQKRIDMHMRAARTFWNLNRWIAIRMDALGGLFSAGLGACLIALTWGGGNGTETSSIPLESLRSNVTVVPQQPELSSRTVRENLDPFGEWEDAVLWDALQVQAVGLSQPQDDSHQTRDSDSARANIELDTPIAPGGLESLSLGQRQMVALVRAIMRRSKLVILDEATAAIGTAFLCFLPLPALLD